MINTQLLTLVILPLLAAFLGTALLTPLTIMFAKRFGLVDDPKRSNHAGIIHTTPIPRGGGIPMFLGATIAAAFFLPYTNRTYAIFFAGLIALIIGVIDDKLNARSKDVSPYLRFLINILSAVIVVSSGVSIGFITNPLGGILHLDLIKLALPFGQSISLSQGISILWIMWVMNMLNWSKGIDGQMPGIVAISSIVIGIVSLRFAADPHTLTETTLAFIIAGASLGFLLYNYSPSRIFPGYGATALYMMLAVVSILSSAKLATALLVMGVPIVDGSFTIVRRLLSHKSPFSGDNKHLHHLLLRLGYTQRQIAFFYWLVSALLGIVALSLESKSKLFALVMLVVIVTGALLFLHFTVRYSHERLSS